MRLWLFLICVKLCYYSIGRLIHEFTKIQIPIYTTIIKKIYDESIFRTG
ncbi:hypothetical protein HNQ80_002207 [Anaerosolibacter carboniphilus]|uniref:Uncharacterized protein n=1 Tax=Anaerosolibacter carboniphilus TaxID=1417629 RepID=A0A841KV71_9FIRM|nr:hypothetical protein [Anaerosolibacter carboniphilus]